MIKLMVMMVVLFVCSFCLAENKGFCPPLTPANIAPSKKASPPTSADPDKKYFGTVTLLTEVSDTGYVCSAHVIRGINKDLDKKTERMVKGWHFDPPRKNGKGVPVVVSLDVNYWRTSNGEIVSDPPPPQSSASAEEPAH
jgi:hypothetical protein